MNLLVPCAGRSSRFPTQLPKYLLSMPDGRLMFEVAVAPFREEADRIVFAILKEHDDAYHSADILRELIPGCEVIVLDQVTRGEAETVLEMIRGANIDSAFLVKDSDSYFEPQERFDPSWNYVSVGDARADHDVALFNKSFAAINEQGYIVGMTEKEITSAYFSCGGYFFADPAEYEAAFRRYDAQSIGGEFYVSSIIDMMIDDGTLFRPMVASHYADWGTHDDWIRHRRKVATYVFDLDGVIYENGTRYWAPRWGENEVIESVRDRVAELRASGNYIVIMTSRPESLRETTQAQLTRDGVVYDQLVMGVHHGQRILVNDYSSSNPYPTAVAVNTPRDSGDVVDRL